MRESVSSNSGVSSISFSPTSQSNNEIVNAEETRSTRPEFENTASSQETQKVKERANQGMFEGVIKCWNSFSSWISGGASYVWKNVKWVNSKETNKPIPIRPSSSTLLEEIESTGKAIYGRLDKIEKQLKEECGIPDERVSAFVEKLKKESINLNEDTQTIKSYLPRRPLNGTSYSTEEIKRYEKDKVTVVNMVNNYLNGRGLDSRNYDVSSKTLSIEPELFSSRGPSPKRLPTPTKQSTLPFKGQGPGHERVRIFHS